MQRRRPGLARSGCRPRSYLRRQTRGQIADKNRALTQCLGKQTVIAGAADLDTAELRQMRRHELRVEKKVAAEPQARDEMNQRDLAGIADPAEHALAEKRRPERDPVQSADQLA